MMTTAATGFNASLDSLRLLLRGLPDYGALFWLAVALWVVSEVRIFSRHGLPAGKSTQDANTLRPLIATIIASCIAAGLLRQFHALPMNAAIAMPAHLIGCLLMVAGVALRQWSVATLDHHFTVEVHIHDDHRLIRHGPYRWLRHPSYTGLWLTTLGMGWAMRDWASLIVLGAVPVIALMPRIRVEETALATHFPEDYPRYARQTRRLVPFLW